MQSDERRGTEDHQELHFLHFPFLFKQYTKNNCLISCYYFTSALKYNCRHLFQYEARLYLNQIVKRPFYAMNDAQTKLFKDLKNAKVKSFYLQLFNLFLFQDKYGLNVFDKKRRASQLYGILLHKSQLLYILLHPNSLFLRDHISHFGTQSQTLEDLTLQGSIFFSLFRSDMPLKMSLGNR